MAFMPWKEVEPMQEKERFVTLAQSGRFTISELCKDFGISRKTGHKYLQRYELEGKNGLVERSRRPKSCPWITDGGVEKLILKERRQHPTWGPKKLKVVLERKHGVERPPHESTIGLILKRHGLSQKRKRKVGCYRMHPEHLTEPSRPNEVWSVDFKGCFQLQNGERCDPLTVCDRYSRYVIAAHACPNQQFKGTLRICKEMMRYHGLPEVIRVDNGTPFASIALGGLSSLSVWWMEQGIRVEYIAPASPQQNGSHERMHRDLKAEATKPPSCNLAAQQKRFERWRQVYNCERPHEALDMCYPREIYRVSARRLGETDKMSYPESDVVRRISQSGALSYLGETFHLGEIYAGCRMGLRENAEGVVELHYANLHLGNLEFDSGEIYGRPRIVRPDAEPERKAPRRKGKTSRRKQNGRK
jgi:transposase InsO family protein